jgi:hypothetical protein
MEDGGWREPQCNMIADVARNACGGFVGAPQGNTFACRFDGSPGLETNAEECGINNPRTPTTG